MATAAPAQDLTKYYRALEKADAAGDTAGATEIANYIRTAEKGQGAASAQLAAQGQQDAQTLQAPQVPLTPTQQRNTRALQSQINPIEAGKNLGKGLISLADTGINTVSGLGSQVLQPVVRPFTSAARAKEIAAPVNNVLGRALGIENDPAYKGEALRRGTEKVAEVVAPYADKAITSVSEATGLPKEDVGNMAANLALGLPIIGLGKVGARPSIAQARAQAIREINAANQVPDAVARAPRPEPATSDILRTPVAPIARESTPSAQSASSAALPANQIPATPTTITPQQARANALRAEQEAAARGEAPKPLLNVADQDTMIGVGSGTPGEGAIRMQRAQNLRTPVALTKGQAGRDTGTLQFEHDIARQQSSTLGAPLINRRNVQNEKLLQNFDQIVDEDFAPQFAKPETSRLVGEETKAALTENFNKDRANVKALYEKAKESNADRVVNIQDINDYVLNLTPSERSSAPIKALMESLEKNNLGDPNMVRFNDLQEGYRTINRVTNATDNTQLHYAGELKSIINKIGNEQADDAFRVAQAARRKLGQEFQNVKAVDQIIANKRGRHSADAQVAIEDIVDRVVRRGSLEDLKHIENALGKSERGKQALNEIRAQTVLDLKNSITKNIMENERGDRVISAKQMDTLIREMDADGKLEHLFGKKVAAELRDLRAVIMDVSHVPQGANTSGTTHALVRLVQGLGKAGGIGDPFGITKTIGNLIDERRIAKEVERSLKFTPEELAKELRAQRRRDLKVEGKQ